MEGLTVRRMMPSDLPDVVAIEILCHGTPWSEASFRHEIENKDALFDVAVLDNLIAGYICIRRILDETHLLNLSVRPELHCRGIGSTLLATALKELKEIYPDVETVTLEVRESNTSAITLYEKSGFIRIGIRKDYFRIPSENALIMNCSTKSDS